MKSSKYGQGTAKTLQTNWITCKTSICCYHLFCTNKVPERHFCCLGIATNLTILKLDPIVLTSKQIFFHIHIIFLLLKHNKQKFSKVTLTFELLHMTIENLKRRKYLSFKFMACELSRRGIFIFSVKNFMWCWTTPATTKQGDAKEPQGLQWS